MLQHITGKIAGAASSDPPAVPLFRVNDFYGINKRVIGFTPRASQYIGIYPISVGTT